MTTPINLSAYEQALHAERTKRGLDLAASPASIRVGARGFGGGFRGPISFDPGKHPRDPHGQFRGVLQSLAKGVDQLAGIGSKTVILRHEEPHPLGRGHIPITHESGIKVVRGLRGFTVHTPDGEKRHRSADDAAKAALAAHAEFVDKRLPEIQKARK